jgi:hypothetical protein
MSRMLDFPRRRPWRRPLCAAVLAGIGMLPASGLRAQEKPAVPQEKPVTAAQDKPLPLALDKPLPLAEVARKELERRKALTVPSIVFTAKDVRPAPPRSAAAAVSAPSASASAPGVRLPEEDEEAKQQAAWRERIGAVREELRRNEMFADALQSRINGLGRDFASRDDPYQRAQLGLDREKAIAELARVQADIVKNRARIAEIEEEARRAGIPPGWLR